MKETAILAVKEASKIIMDNFQKKHDIKIKNYKEIVTEVDRMAEKKIISVIQKKFPDHQILGEETGEHKTDSEYKWIIDPIDGTTNYSIGHPFFNTSIGLAKDNEIILGVVYAHVTDELFVAEKGKGAYMNGKKIFVSDRKDLDFSFITYCHGKTPEDVKTIISLINEIRPKSRDMVRMKSAALELAYLASGRVETFVYNNVSSWDVAAGVLLVKEAGGKITDFEGNDWNLTKNNLVATNGKIHEKILNLISSAVKK